MEGKQGRVKKVLLSNYFTWSCLLEIVPFGSQKAASNDCLSKTQVSANPKRGNIGTDACPVLVGHEEGLTLVEISG